MTSRFVLELVVTIIVNLKRDRRSLVHLIHDCDLAGRQFAVWHAQKSSKSSFKTRRATDRELDWKWLQKTMPLLHAETLNGFIHLVHCACLNFNSNMRTCMPLYTLFFARLNLHGRWPECGNPWKWGFPRGLVSPTKSHHLEKEPCSDWHDASRAGRSTNDK